MEEVDVLFRAAKNLAAILDKTADKMLPKEIADIVKFHSKGAGVAGLAATFVGSTIASLFPGIGSVAAAGINGAMVFALTWVSGLVYLKLLAVLAKKKVSFDSVSADEIKSVMKDVMASENIKGLLKEAKNIFTRQKESGELDGINADDWTDAENGEETEAAAMPESMGVKNAESTAVSDEAARRPKFCPECGAKVSYGKFCSECGAKLV